MKTYFKILLIYLLLLTAVVRSQQNKMQHFTAKDGLPNVEILDVIQDEVGYLWLATNKGLFQFDGNHFSLKTPQKTNTLFSKREVFFIGGKDQLSVKTNTKSTTYKSKEIFKIRSIDGKIYLATKEGIVQFVENSLKPVKISNAIDFAIVNDIIKVQNTIYIATIKGLWSLDSFNKPKQIHKISDDYVVSFLKNKSEIIAATLHNGFKVIKNNRIIKTIISDKNSTGANLCNNEIWVFTNGNGIEVFNANDYSFQRKINKYNTTVSNKINVVFNDKNKNIWIGSSDKGLYKIPNNEYLVKKESTIFFSSVQVNYKKIKAFKNQKIFLKSDENTISFQFKTVSLDNAKNINYRYKLNNTLSPWSSQNTVVFANLKAGDYTFTAQSKIGNNNSKEISFSFTIDVPFYQKAWFVILVVSLIFGFIAIIIEVRIKKIKRKNQQQIAKLQLENHLITLEQKALQLQMNPHFIFNVLNGIKAYGNAGNTTALNKTISQFSILLRSILNNSRLAEISLKEEINTLENYLHLEQNMNAKTFKFSIKTNLNTIEVDEILIPPMLIQPFIENSIQHGFQPNTKNGEILIQFEVKHRFLQCVIKDNGVGIVQSKKQKHTETHKSLALEITKERIVNLSSKHSFKIEEILKDKLVKGTKVWFQIPLKTDF